MSLKTLARTSALNTTASIASLSLAIASISVPQQARAQQKPIYGAEGGRYFEYNCGPGRILVGLRGSAGILIDNIQAICARVVGGSSFVDAAASGPIFGGNRPQDQHVECPVGYGIAWSSIALNQNYPHIGGLRLACQELTNRTEGGTKYIELRGTGHLEGYQSPMVWDPSIEIYGNSIACAGGYAVGIRGRAEQFVDALGFICASSATVATSTEGHTLGKRKKRADAAGPRDPNDSYQSSIPQTQHTLGKRKRKAPEITGGAGSESNPNPMPEQSGGVSIFTDSTNVGTPSPPNEPAPATPPSPLINGTYSTTVAVTDSRCLTQDLRGTWRGLSELKPQPALIIPLQNFGPMFAAPVAIQVQGLVVSQSTQVEMRAGPVAGAVPAEFNGAFSNDGSEFNVRFTAGSPLCRIAGTISGQRL